MDTKDLGFSEVSESSDSFKGDDGVKKTPGRRYRPTPKRLLPVLRPIDFEDYVKNKCEGKIKILDRTTFHQIKKHTVIIFNHFREKCAYHTNWLDKLYQLALLYGEQINFIAADILDINVMNSKWHSIDLFCRIGNPEKVPALIYAIDEHQRIHEHLITEKSLESLKNLCENLLQGCLFISESLPEQNNCALVKICVHKNYKQLVTDSCKDVLLIAGLEDYSQHINEYKINYESLADQLKCSNLEVVYINGGKNYIPFELGISSYPAILILPHYDKTNYVNPLVGPYNEDNVITCIKSYLKDTKKCLEKNQLERQKNTYQPLNILPDFKLDFEELEQYLQANCQNYIKVFERQTFQRTNRFVIIAFMNFENGECLSHHIKWIDQIYQVAINLSSPREYFIADFQDIDVINPAWKSEDFRKHCQSEFNTPKIFGIDLNKNKFVLKDFRSAASLFYFAYSLNNGELYISEPWPNMSEENLVKTCIADGIHLSISSIKTDVLLAIYYSTSENCTEFLKLLELIARELRNFPLKVMKIDSRLNCISLELDDSIYPSLYYIPQSDKTKRLRFTGDNYSRNEIIKFIKENNQENIK